MHGVQFRCDASVEAEAEAMAMIPSPTRTCALADIVCRFECDATVENEAMAFTADANELRLARSICPPGMSLGLALATCRAKEHKRLAG